MSTIKFKNGNPLATINAWGTGRLLDQWGISLWHPKARRITGIMVKESDILPPQGGLIRNGVRDGVAEPGVVIAPVKGKKGMTISGPAVQIPKESIPELIEELKKYI